MPAAWLRCCDARGGTCDRRVAALSLPLFEILSPMEDIGAYSLQQGHKYYYAKAIAGENL